MGVRNDEPLGAAPEVGVGVSDSVLLAVSGVGFCMLVATIYSIILTRLKSAEEIEEEDKDFNYDEKLANADVSTLNRAQRRARARHIMKQQRRIAPPATTPDDNEGALQNGEEQDQQLPPALDPSVRHLSRKERQKAAKAAEKEERTLYEEERRRQQQEAMEVAQKEKKEKERVMALKLEEDKQARQKQREQEEMDAFASWKTFLESSDGSTSISVKEWISEAQKTRIQHLSVLAERFQTTEDKVKERIQDLLKTSRVTGIIEADGRFVYLSKKELREIASFVQSQDKVDLKQISQEVEKIISQ